MVNAHVKGDSLFKYKSEATFGAQSHYSVRFHDTNKCSGNALSPWIHIAAELMFKDVRSTLLQVRISQKVRCVACCQTNVLLIHCGRHVLRDGNLRIEGKN